jgi:hypothetical protein
MSKSFLEPDISEDRIHIKFTQERSGIISRLLSKSSHPPSFSSLNDEHKDILFALADLRNWQDRYPEDVEIFDDHLSLSHNAIASLTSKTAQTLGLPADVHLTLKTDVTGVLGKPDFKLDYEWSRHGRRETPKRVGALLYTSEGNRRIPLWMKSALDLADGFDATRPMEEHWSALAAFRQSLEPDENLPDTMPENSEMAALSMTAFLRRLEVKVANRFSISPDRSLGQFEVIPYSSQSLDDAGVDEEGISETDAELSGEALAAFQMKLHSLGPRGAYQLGSNSYLVIEKSIAPVLSEISRVQKSDREERKAFIQNPRSFITDAVSQHLSDQGVFEGLDEASQQEMIEDVAGPALIESREYSQRVTGVTIYEKPKADFESSGTAWLPEVFEASVAKTIQELPTEDLRELQAQMNTILESGSGETVRVGGEDVEVTLSKAMAIAGEIERREPPTSPEENEEENPNLGPIILEALDNFEDLSWHAQFSPRHASIPIAVPESITTPLRHHQIDSFQWATSAWSKGLPGILNADEQGLGKTLQTIAFLNWLQTQMVDPAVEHRGPILIVAPKSLLRNWEAEVETHLAARKFGTLYRLYGASVSSSKRRGSQGRETDSGELLLDLDWLEDALNEGRAHRYWILTTYDTLSNYQHSLGNIPFSAMVMDEIQNIKNHRTIKSKAVEAMNADFRIGLTGTPVENSVMDLWTIMDRIAPGSLGAGSDFKEQYGFPDEDNLAELHSRIFKPKGSYPPLGLRRLKTEVAKDLPSKTRLLHPRLMPQVQSATYDQAQMKLAAGGAGAALKMLHHIRSVSVHPGTKGIVSPEDFIGMSARMSATFEILKSIHAKGERVLVFIEHREIQFRFAELVRHFLGLDEVDIINGDTPIPKRQAIVERFQKHLDNDGGFDVLVLGPRAAGTGLTLTAATHVIHLSRWWNPAVEEQCNDRVHRIGQTRPIEVHVPLAIHPEYGSLSFDCNLQSLMQRKRTLAEQTLWPMGDTELEVSKLTQATADAKRQSSPTMISDCMTEMYTRDGLDTPEPDERGAYVFS